MLEMANKGYTTATDFADFLVRKMDYHLEKLIRYHLKL